MASKRFDNYVSELVKRCEYYRDKALESVGRKEKKGVHAWYWAIHRAEEHAENYIFEEEFQYEKGIPRDFVSGLLFPLFNQIEKAWGVIP